MASESTLKFAIGKSPSLPDGLCDMGDYYLATDGFCIFTAVKPVKIAKTNIYSRDEYWAKMGGNKDELVNMALHHVILDIGKVSYKDLENAVKRAKLFAERYIIISAYDEALIVLGEGYDGRTSTVIFGDYPNVRIAIDANMLDHAIRHVKDKESVNLAITEVDGVRGLKLENGNGDITMICEMRADFDAPSVFGQSIYWDIENG